MTDDPRGRIEQLRSCAARLNTLTDSAAQTVRSVEDFLNDECSLGVRAEVWYESRLEESADFPPVCFYSAIAYARVGSRYRIAIIHGDDYSPENATIKAWSDCTRDEKLESIGKLPELLDKVAAELNSKLAEAEAALESVTRALGSMKARGKR